MGIAGLMCISIVIWQCCSTGGLPHCLSLIEFVHQAASIDPAQAAGYAAFLLWSSDMQY